MKRHGEDEPCRTTTRVAITSYVTTDRRLVMRKEDFDLPLPELRAEIYSETSSVEKCKSIMKVSFSITLTYL